MTNARRPRFTRAFFGGTPAPLARAMLKDLNRALTPAELHREREAEKERARRAKMHEEEDKLEKMDASVAYSYLTTGRA